MRVVAALVATTQHLDALDAPPPGRSGGVIVQSLPDPVGHSGRPPHGQEAISSHGLLLPCGLLTISLPSIPAWRWSGTVQ